MAIEQKYFLLLNDNDLKKGNQSTISKTQNRKWKVLSKALIVSFISEKQSGLDWSNVSIYHIKMEAVNHHFGSLVSADLMFLTQL